MTVVAVQRDRGLALCAGESGRSSVPDGVAPMALQFNGTVYYRGEDGALQMVSDHLDTLIESLSWEGYALYPYIPSATKNATPTPFGIAYPPAYAQALDTTYDHLDLRIALAAPSDAVLHAEVHLLAPVGARHQAAPSTSRCPGRWSAHWHSSRAASTPRCGARWVWIAAGVAVGVIAARFHVAVAAARLREASA
jgi:hypothetical protein